MAAFTLAVGLDATKRQMTQEDSPLTPEEISMAQTIYGNTIDYSKVRIVTDKPSAFLPWGSMTIGNTIYCPRGRGGLKPEFIHEMMHIWQNQKDGGLWSAVKLFLESPQGYISKEVYKYEADSTKKMEDYNIEQQGNMARDLFLLKENIARNPGAPPPALYTSLKKIFEEGVCPNPGPLTTKPPSTERTWEIFKTPKAEAIL